MAPIKKYGDYKEVAEESTNLIPGGTANEGSPMMPPFASWHPMWRYAGIVVACSFMLSTWVVRIYEL